MVFSFFISRHGAVLAEPKGFELTNQLATEARTAGLNKFWIGAFSRLCEK